MATSGSGVTGAADPFFGKHAAAPAPAPYYDPESLAEAEYAAAFADRGVRDGFVSRVLTIVCVQLVVTVAATAAMFRPTARAYVAANQWTLLTSWGFAFAVSIAISCSRTLRHAHPHNLVALGLFTLAYAYLIAATTAFYSASAVVIALGVTTATVAGAVAYIRVKGVDVARSSGFLAIASWSFLVALIVGSVTRSSALSIVLAAIGSVLFTMYLLHDLQLIMGGSSFVSGAATARGGGLAFSPDDAVFAALTLYMDVVTIFIQVLQLVQAAQDGGGRG